MTKYFLDASAESGKAFISQDIPGEVHMLNLLRFREVADYSDFPQLTPEAPITGKQAFGRYMTHIRPIFESIGSEIVFQGASNKFLIGPQDEAWDWMILVRYKSRKAFIGFGSSEAYLSGIGHRKAALQDSRLLPIVKQDALI